MRIAHQRILVLLLVPLLSLASLSLVSRGSATGAEEGAMFVPSFDGTLIDINVCKPAGASAEAPAPIILHSHGWGGSKSGCGSFGSWLDSGFGVVSITQRGFGASGGQAHIHDPEFEGRDNIAVIDHVAGFSWVLLDGPGDPVMGAIGGSYGGGYQFLIAFVETAATGSTRLDVLAPEITWFDLTESLAPSDVVRSAWVAALYAAGAASVHEGIHQAFAYGVATGQFPDGSVPLVYDVKSDLYGNSPAAWVAQDILLDVPVLIGQGTTDNLFNLNQGWKNFERSLTPEAREQSRFIAYNGGHVLPNVYPVGVGGSGDACSAPYGGFAALTRAFFRNHLLGEDNAIPESPYSLATIQGDCVTADSLDAWTSFGVADVTLATAAGAPQHIPIAQGPMTVAGIGQVRATLTSLGIEQRAFLALSVGTTPLTAQVLDNNMMPLRVAAPVLGEPVTIELAGVAAHIGVGETLYLTVTPVSDMSFAHGSRTPGAILLRNVVVDVPVLDS